MLFKLEKLIKKKKLFSNEKYIVIEKDFFHDQDITESNYLERGILNLAEAKYWREEGCGAACLEMVIHAIEEKHIKFGDIIRLGQQINAYDKERGWIHDSMVRILKSYNIKSFRKKMKSLESLARLIKDGYILILSVTTGLGGGNFDENGKVKKKGGHLVVCFGYKTDNNCEVSGLLINDPDYWPGYKKNKVWVGKKLINNSWNGNLIFTKIHEEK
ncbi:MAG: C39 family peptidase [bacterium]|nr:C39 family peptidase [bacterium]